MTSTVFEEAALQTSPVKRGGIAERDKPLAIVLATVSSGSFSAQTVDDAPEATESPVVAERPGTVLGSEGEHVQVRLGDVDVSLPASLFDEPALRRYGASVVYRILKRPDGTRYQAVAARSPNVDESLLGEARALLDELVPDDD